MTPSTGRETAYQTTTTALGHVVLGMALTALVGVPMTFLIYVLWEVVQITQGAAWDDAVADTCMVMLGAALTAWPMVAPVVLVVGIVDGIVRGA